MGMGKAMPKVTRERIHTRKKIDINQRSIKEFIKPIDYSKARINTDQMSILEFFKPKFFQNDTEPVAFNIKSKSVSLIKDYDKSIHIQQARKFQEQLKKKEGKLPENRKYWRGYMFYATNNFSEYTVVSMIAKTDQNKIYSPGTRVATASIDEDSVLTHIEVEKPFQNQKVGSELIRFISQRAPEFMVFGGTGYNSRYRLTSEGAKLVTSCVTNGILKTEQVIMACPPSPDN